MDYETFVSTLKNNWRVYRAGITEFGNIFKTSTYMYVTYHAISFLAGLLTNM